MIENNSQLGVQMLVHDDICESVVIGTILSIRDAFFQVSEILDIDCFQNGKHKDIWESIVSVSEKGDNIDIITVVADLASKGSTIKPEEVVALSSKCSIYDIQDYALRLKTLSIRRRLWYLGQKLVNAGVAETEEIEEIQQAATEELTGVFGKTQGVFTLTDAVMALSDIITRNLSKGSNLTGTPTGFRKLDEKGGLHASDLVIIAGESSQGKSSFMLSIIKNAAEKGFKTAVYSLEMTKEQLAARFVAMKTGISASDIMYSGELRRDELEIIDSAKATIPGDKIFFDERSTSSIETILLSIRNMKIKYDIDGAAVDYLQILNVNQKTSSYTREQAMGDALRRLKNLAKELGIWIIALSQLSRNQYEPEPTLSRLRDSGQIAEAADVVMLIYRPEYYNRTFPKPFEILTEDEVKGKAMINVAKGRNIGVFQFLTDFNPSLTLFSDNESDSLYGQLQPVEEDAPF